MNKPLILVECPVNTRSGYGVHSKMIVKSLIAMDKFEIAVFPTRWGNTPQTGLRQDNPEDKKIIDLFRANLDRKPDIHIQMTIPSEFRPLGEFNIGITAGTEVTVAPLPFVEGCNRMDLVITPSKFTRDVLVGTKYDRKNEQGQIVESIQVTKPVEVLFEGLDTSVFNKNNTSKSELTKTLDSIKEPFLYLFCGHWLQGQLGEDRKDVGMLVKVFIDTFKNKKNRPALVIKSSGAGFSITERDQVMDRINQIQELVREEGFVGKLPNVYLINGDLTDGQMNELYNHPKVKAMVSFHKGEGFGLPLLEFTSTGKPVVASNYSGPLDFLNPEFSVLLPGKQTKIHGSAVNEWLPKEGEWFSVNYQYASQVLNDVFEKYDKYLERSRKSVKWTKDNFSLEIMTEKFLEILEKGRTLGITEQQGPIKINLPKLKKVTE